MALPTDLRLRIRRRIRAKTTRLQHRLGWPTLATGCVRAAEHFHHPIDARNRDALISRYRALFTAAAQSEVEAAQRLLNHQFHLLGHGMDHPGRIAWSRDPVTGKHWSKGFSADIPYRGPDRLGDIKLPWELNKHQYFFTLGKATWLTGDPRYAQEIIAQIDHWIDDNPCHRGIHWISALESGMRAVSWILSYPFFAEFCNADFLERMMRSIAQHMLFVERNLSDGRFANTHLAGEAAVLVIGGLFLNCRHSKRWLTLGLHHLNEQIHEQVRDDGVHAEQSVAYHRFFLDQYYLVDALLRANGRSLPAATLERMERMTQFLMDVLHPDGSAPTFGDGDDARGIWCRADASRDYLSLLALGALTFNRGDFRMIARAPTEELLWLHGESGIDRFTTPPTRLPDHTSSAYAHAGYYVMRGGWNAADPVLVFDAGPLGHGPAGHGHADALSFQLFARAYAFLTDPGTYSYNLDYEWRNRFRSTRAHNTVAVDGLDQSTAQDRMAWTTSARAHCRRWITTPWFDLVDGEHDGYARLQHPVTHRRVIAFIKPDVWVICDQLIGPGEHRFELLMHFRPDCGIAERTQGSGVTLRAPSLETVHVRLIAPSRQDGLRTDGPTCEVIDEWHSDNYGEKVRTHAVRYAGGSKDSPTILTCLTTATDAIVEADVSQGALRIKLRRPGRPAERVVYRLTGTQPLQEEDLQFDGEVLFQRGTAADTDILWASAATKIVVRDHLEARCATGIGSLALKENVCELACESGADPVVSGPERIQMTIVRQ